MQIEPLDLKYVIVLSHSIETPLTAPQWIDHDRLAGGTSPVVSAGFFRIEPDPQRPGLHRVLAFGESISLGRHSRGEQDAKIIEQFHLPWQAAGRS